MTQSWHSPSHLAILCFVPGPVAGGMHTNIYWILPLTILCWRRQLRSFINMTGTYPILAWLIATLLLAWYQQKHCWLKIIEMHMIHLGDVKASSWNWFCLPWILLPYFWLQTQSIYSAKLSYFLISALDTNSNTLTPVYFFILGAASPISLEVPPHPTHLYHSCWYVCWGRCCLWPLLLAVQFYCCAQSFFNSYFFTSKINTMKIFENNLKKNDKRFCYLFENKHFCYQNKI